MNIRKDLLERDVFIFDLDGTLLNSVGIWNEVDKALIRKLGGADEDIREIQRRRDDILSRMSSSGNRYVAYCSELGKICGSDLSGEEIHTLRYDLAGNYLLTMVRYKKGAVEFIKEMKKRGKKLAIATTTNARNVDIYAHKNRNTIKALPMDDYFYPIYTRENVTEIKPSPEVYEKVLKTLKARPEDCVVFEDSLTGVTAARRANLDVIVMHDHYSDKDREEIKKLTPYEAADFELILKNYFQD